MSKFINSYNFVPFGDESPIVQKKENVYRSGDQKELLTGWIDIDMHIKTPLIIPDGAYPRFFVLDKERFNEKEKIRKDRAYLEYDFIQLFNTETNKKEFAVPGSELRGMIRSTYEAVTNSCVPFLMNDKPMSQRVPLYGALHKRGLLGYDGKRWVLYKTNKELEEVIVVPIYETRKGYYVESLDSVRYNKENYIKDSDGNSKYFIIEKLDLIEQNLRNFVWNNEQIHYGVKFFKNERVRKFWDIKENNQVLEYHVKKEIVHYLFIKADGTLVKEKTATATSKGWLQYNVPVDKSRIYHIAYLNKSDENPIYKWENSSAKGDENKTKKEDKLYAEAYKKLLSSLSRDGVPNSDKKIKLTKDGIRSNDNYECNYALKNALNDACDNRARLVPVYYFIVQDGDKEIAYLSGSADGRIAQRRKWADILKGHTPCVNDLCPACLLFGTIKDGGMKGHVRFTNAFMKNTDSVKTTNHILQILGSPRTTAFEFYLKKPSEKATYWNYDFYGVTEYKDNDESSHTNYYHLKNAVPRGRKMYWHHKPLPDDRKKSNLNNTMQSIDKGCFTFKVYFDQITKNQLQDLIWSINLGENKKESTLQHKLGHAKPLGYGSVKLIVNDVKVRQFNRNESSFSYSVKDIKDVGININDITPSFDMNSNEVKSLLTMCNTNIVGNNIVDYPRTKREGPIYEWFSENRKNPKTLEVLPFPTDPIISLNMKKKK